MPRLKGKKAIKKTTKKESVSVSLNASVSPTSTQQGDTEKKQTPLKNTEGGVAPAKGVSTEGGAGPAKGVSKTEEGVRVTPKKGGKTEGGGTPKQGGKTEGGVTPTKGVSSEGGVTPKKGGNTEGGVTPTKGVSTEGGVLPKGVNAEGGTALPSFDEAQATKAVQALKVFYSNQAKESKQLFDAMELIHLEVALDRVPKLKRVRPIMVPLPHSLRGDSTDICLIVRKEKKQKLKEKKIPNVSKIYTPESLKKNIANFEAKRKLMGSYDLFLCEASLFVLLGRVLGKEFIEAKKFPVPIRLGKTAAAAVASARDSTFIHIPRGTSVSVKVGWSNMKEEELVANLKAVVARLSSKFAQNILHYGIRGKDTALLPIYARAIR